jgi:hypothetical protein
MIFWTLHAHFVRSSLNSLVDTSSWIQTCNVFTTRSDCKKFITNGKTFEDYCLVACCAAYSRSNRPTFQRCLLTPSVEALSASETSINFYEATRQHPRRQSSSYLQPLEPEISPGNAFNSHSEVPSSIPDRSHTSMRMMGQNPTTGHAIIFLNISRLQVIWPQQLLQRSEITDSRDNA